MTAAMDCIHNRMILTIFRHLAWSLYVRTPTVKCSWTVTKAALSVRRMGRNPGRRQRGHGNLSPAASARAQWAVPVGSSCT